MDKIKRVILKISGESLANKAKNVAIDYEKIAKLVKEVKFLQAKGLEIGIVIGAGNFWRGASATKNGIPRNRADYIGMLATIMNGLAIESIFVKKGIKTEVMSAVGVDQKIAQLYVNEIALKKLKEKIVLIFVGGTGRPFFTTDTAATLVCSELNMDLILFAKNNTDGVYDADPNLSSNAKHYDQISYDEILKKNLTFMDLTATSMAKTNDIKMIVFNIDEEDPISRLFKNEIIFTKVGF